MQISFDIFDNSLVSVEVDNINAEPWELTLTEFLNIPEWKAFPDPKARDEHKGVYVMQRPDGSMWRGGWIGKFKTEEQAKRKFHKERIYYHLLWSGDVPDRVLTDYPNYLEIKQKISEYEKKVYIGEGDYARVSTTDGDVYFHRLDFPMYSRVSARGFVNRLGLCGDETPKSYGIFNAREIASIALYRCLRHAGVSKEHRPHLMLPEYRKLCFSSQDNMNIRFQIPTEFNQQGQPVRFAVHEGKCRYEFWNESPIVIYHIEGETKEHFLQPTELCAIQIELGTWKEISL